MERFYMILKKDNRYQFLGILDCYSYTEAFIKAMDNKSWEIYLSNFDFYSYVEALEFTYDLRNIRIDVSYAGLPLKAVILSNHKGSELIAVSTKGLEVFCNNKDKVYPDISKYSYVLDECKY